MCRQAQLMLTDSTKVAFIARRGLIQQVLSRQSCTIEEPEDGLRLVVLVASPATKGSYQHLALRFTQPLEWLGIVSPVRLCKTYPV